MNNPGEDDRELLRRKRRLMTARLIELRKNTGTLTGREIVKAVQDDRAGPLHDSLPPRLRSS
jgi:hypothetical protein